MTATDTTAVVDAPAETGEVADTKPKRKGRAAARKRLAFTADREPLHKALAGAVLAILPGGLPVLADVKLTVARNRLTITATDLALSIETTIPVKAAKAGTVLVPGRLLFELVRSAGDEIRIAEGDGECDFTSGDFQATLNTHDAADFPVPPPVDGDPLEVDSLLLFAAVARTVKAASNDPVRPMLNTLFIHNVDGQSRLVATDSYRLHVTDLGEKMTAGDVVIPARFATVASRVLAGESDNVAVTVTASHIAMSTPSTTVIARIVEGDYPNYAGLFPATSDLHVTVDRRPLAAAITRMRALIDADTTVVLTFEAEQVTVSAYGVDVGNAAETIRCQNGPDEAMRIGFKPEYLRDALAVQVADSVTFAMRDAIKAVVIEVAGNTAVRHLLMPVRVPG
ncbi:DNA polymerase III subunit beta [Desertimonas flava]|uniref:DNA polymerase III subunit beta n=1 Tax=Desertimonas flava TaxID=2064846 RepID=UPI000E350599|nr:DNA polymerase III subunit beta [Desertimonas flava]